MLFYVAKCVVCTSYVIVTSKPIRIVDFTIFFFTFIIILFVFSLHLRFVSFLPKCWECFLCVKYCSSLRNVCTIVTITVNLGHIFSYCNFFFFKKNTSIGDAENKTKKKKCTQNWKKCRDIEK